MGDTLTHLSIRIKEARMREGISQKSLAQRIDDPPDNPVKQGYISEAESGQRERIQHQIAQYFIDTYGYPPEFFYPTNPGDVVKRLDNIDRKIEHLDKNISSLRRLIERWDEGQE